MTSPKKTKKNGSKTKPKLAVLDGDILVYQTAFWAEANDPDKIPKKMKELIKQWTPPGAEKIKVALSCSRNDNFRKEQWPFYKDNRDALYTPEFLSDVREHVLENYDCRRFDNIEADDILGIYASSNKGISVTIDKDLKGVSGWHFNPSKDKDLRFINKEEAYRFFCIQWMTGDSTDGIPGLWRIGPKKAEKLLDEWEKDEWEQNIIELYCSDKHKVRKECDIAPEDLAIVMARCVKILTTGSYNMKTQKVKLWSPKVGS
tara:strand:+ start:645 stop:1424 length:780 start_codon:yes stop_codon:yes gene_type:complete